MELERRGEVSPNPEPQKIAKANPAIDVGCRFVASSLHSCCTDVGSEVAAGFIKTAAAAPDRLGGAAEF